MLMVVCWFLQVFLMMIYSFTTPVVMCQKPSFGTRVSRWHLMIQLALIVFCTGSGLFGGKALVKREKVA